jgi:hypothetical protein
LPRSLELTRYGEPAVAQLHLVRSVQPMAQPRPKKYSKRRIAEIQIYRAIKVLEDDADPISALTLAGAAEEILGKTLRENGRRCAFDHAVNFGEQMWDFLQEVARRKGIRVTRPSDSEVKSRINKVRNELKHKCDGRPVEAYDIWEAEDMIIRAINNYLFLYQKLPRRRLISAWYDHQCL